VRTPGPLELGSPDPPPPAAETLFSGPFTSSLGLVIIKNIIKPWRLSVKVQVEQALDRIRPYLQRDGGDIKLIDITEDGVVKVQLTGACHGCPMSQMTLKQGVERALMKEVPASRKFRRYNGIIPRGGRGAGVPPCPPPSFFQTW
jgi:Fe-S cluster biogenesis protein NfuA